MRQTARTLVIVGRRNAGVAALIPNNARTVAGDHQARISQGRAGFIREAKMEQETTCVGIDVAWDRVDIPDCCQQLQRMLDAIPSLPECSVEFRLR